MSNKFIKHTVRGIGPGYLVLAGYFTISGAAGVVSTDTAQHEDKGVTFVKTSTGYYTGTFDEQYPEILYAGAELEGTASDVDMYIKVAEVSAADKRVRFRAMTGTTETNIPDNNLVRYLVIARGSTVK